MNSCYKSKQYSFEHTYIFHMESGVDNEPPGIPGTQKESTSRCYCTGGLQTGLRRTGAFYGPDISKLNLETSHEEGEDTLHKVIELLMGENKDLKRKLFNLQQELNAVKVENWPCCEHGCIENVSVTSRERVSDFRKSKDFTTRGIISRSKERQIRCIP